MDRKDAESIFMRVKGLRALVIGDLMLDEYLWGKAERISPEAPVQVVDVRREDMRLGGAGNVVNNLVAFGACVSICSVIGGDENGTVLRHAFTGKGVDVSGVFEDPMRMTSKKTRVLAANQQIVRIDRETREEISPEFEEMILAHVRDTRNIWDLFLISDYGKGLLTSRVLSGVIASAQERGIPVIVDPKGSDYRKYRGATIITPNRKEAEVASHIAITDAESLNRAADFLLAEGEYQALLITRSSEGMSLFLNAGEEVHIPTVAREVYDVTGAGDTVVATFGVGLACGLSFERAAQLANVAAGIVVGKVGTSTVSPEEIIGSISHEHQDSDIKIKNLDALASCIEEEKRKGKRIAFTNGCFDLLHVGHVKYLQKARTYGDLLILGLNSDASIRRLKGEKRPLIGQSERAHILAALDCIDYVVIFDEDTPIRLLETLRPHVLVKGADYTPDRVVGKDLVESYGGRVELVEFVDGKSTTNIIEKILQNYS
ncbi:MAG: D-glycero-beta-D-manno-heptose-7-phosphate kinase [Deltaproteobacteria bacterium]|nr:D-glycero-beta-D-manno-heptose-7-phosphate kinase [Deltaproteobacteria bacterium]TLN05257.1 MAG: D-glycero-beta-D-manno-heptose-7-phosphate kinase [bacterium]